MSNMDQRVYSNKELRFYIPLCDKCLYIQCINDSDIQQFTQENIVKKRAKTID